LEKDNKELNAQIIEVLNKREDNLLKNQLKGKDIQEYKKATENAFKARKQEARDFKKQICPQFKKMWKSKK